MTKKIILLILILPVFLMLILFTTTNQVSLAVDLAVERVEINDDKLIYLDYNDEPYKLNYTVYPTNAKNKEVIFSQEKVDDFKEAPLEISKEGYITPKGIGKTLVTLQTVDGGFKDSVIIEVESRTLVSIESGISSNIMYVSEKQEIITKFVPENVSDDNLRYESSNPNVAKVRNNYLYAVSKGLATITVYASNNISSSFNVEVKNKDILDLSTTNVDSYLEEGSIKASVSCDEEYELSYKVYNLANEEVNDILNVEIIDENQLVHVNYSFLSDYYDPLIIELIITTKSGFSVSKKCNIKRLDDSEVTIEFDKPVREITANSSSSLHFTTNPLDIELDLEASVDNDNINILQVTNSQVIFEAKKAGVTEVRLRGKINDHIVETQMFVVVLPKTMMIENSVRPYGLEKYYTFGSENPNGSLATYKLNLNCGSDIGSNFYGNIKYVTSNNAVKVDGDGNLTINSLSIDEYVEVKAIFSYRGKDILSSNIFKIKCVGSAVNVSNYVEMMNAAKSKQKIVLQADIKEDFGKNYDEVYVEIPTTYDYTYYENIGKGRPNVKVLVPLYNDLYGNGFEINAHNVTYKMDSTGNLTTNAIFRGPLDFVRVSDSEVSAASVKAQDNIVFALFENVSVNNVVLSGCDNIEDLVDLNYVGTTVEVLGDNVNINYSRIKNGRTVLRAFGDVSDSDKNINVVISNSILSYAREFVLRLGSNKFYFDSKDNPSPLLPSDNTNKSFPRQNYYKSLSADKKLEYEQNFIKTFVTLDNVAVEKSGIFSIGIDSHFSGPALNSGKDLFSDWLVDWHDLAKTSYGAKLKLTNDVRIYDWKPLENVDSSSLIEVLGNNDKFNQLKFDVKLLVEQLAKDPKYSTILYSDDTYHEYVHGGIAFFGGGKNYSVVEYAEDYNQFCSLNNYQISLKDVGQEFLEVAAGTHPFYFMLSDSNSSSFLPSKQDELFISGNQYNFIK